MPNRYLRASYIDSKRVNELTAEGERMFIRLIVHVDDFGRCEADPELLLGKLFSRQLGRIAIGDVHKWLLELADKGLVQLYVEEDQLYLQMNRWEKGRAMSSKHPSPPKHATHPRAGRGNANTDKEDFEMFWSAYPKKVGRIHALRTFEKLKDRPDVSVLLLAINRQKQSRQWMSEGGKYIPHPATWLSQGRWMDAEKVDVRKAGDLDE